MATAGRTGDSDLDRNALKELLEAAPFRFHFFQAVRLLERIAPERESPGGFVPLEKEAVRFAAHQSTAFPASEIQTLTFPEGKPPRMTVNFMGLTGPLGLLPLYYTEYIMERMRNKDYALRDFLDIFNHSAISLFYQAWKKYRFGVTNERVKHGPVSKQLLALVGLGTPGLGDRQGVNDDAFMYYAGLFSQHPRSAASLERVLADYFGVPVAVEQFAGAWYKLDRSSQSCLDESGRYTEMLGFGAVLGDEIWDQQSVVRIVLGPLSLSQYLDFLPTGTAWESLRSLVRFHSNDELDFDLQLVLRRDETPPCELGNLGEAAPRLGWTSWAKTKAMQRDPKETILRL
jgi:type VI secretion system protein ImpH